MFAVLILLFTSPRLLMFFWWVLTPGRWDHAFDTIVVPVLGFLFLPMTTLTFVALAPHGSAVGADWLWLALALFIDLCSGGLLRFGQRRTVVMP